MEVSRVDEFQTFAFDFLQCSKLRSAETLSKQEANYQISRIDQKGRINILSDENEGMFEACRTFTKNTTHYVYAVTLGSHSISLMYLNGDPRTIERLGTINTISARYYYLHTHLQLLLKIIAS